MITCDDYSVVDNGDGTYTASGTMTYQDGFGEHGTLEIDTTVTDTIFTDDAQIYFIFNHFTGTVTGSTTGTISSGSFNLYDPNQTFTFHGTLDNTVQFNMTGPLVSGANGRIAFNLTSVGPTRVGFAGFSDDLGITPTPSTVRLPSPFLDDDLIMMYVLGTSTSDDDSLAPVDSGSQTWTQLCTVSAQEYSGVWNRLAIYYRFADSSVDDSDTPIGITGGPSYLAWFALTDLGRHCPAPQVVTDSATASAGPITGPDMGSPTISGFVVAFAANSAPIVSFALGQFWQPDNVLWYQGGLEGGLGQEYTDPTDSSDWSSIALSATVSSDSGTTTDLLFNQTLDTPPTWSQGVPGGPDTSYVAATVWVDSGTGPNINNLTGNLGDGSISGPRASFTATPTTGTTPLTVSFDGTASHELGGSIVQWDWDFGDGNTLTGQTDGGPVSNTYAADGDYTATLTVTDASSVTNSTTVHITGGVADEDPVADFSQDPGIGRVPLTVTFDGTSAYDPDGTIVSYDWDFDDGSPHGTTALVSHTYVTSGIYTPTLTVTDDRGGTNTHFGGISVNAQPNLEIDVVFNQTFRTAPTAVGTITILDDGSLDFPSRIVLENSNVGSLDLGEAIVTWTFTGGAVIEVDGGDDPVSGVPMPASGVSGTGFNIFHVSGTTSDSISFIVEGFNVLPVSMFPFDSGDFLDGHREVSYSFGNNGKPNEFQVGWIGFYEHESGS